MHTFRDNKGRSWAVEIHVTAIKRCRGLLQIDLLSLIDGGFEGFDKLFRDVVTLVDVIYVLCKDEADKLGVSDEDFGRSLHGDALGDAAKAFRDEYIDFFQDPRVRAGLKKVMEKSERMMDRVKEDMEMRLEAFDADLEAKKLIASSGNSRALSVSTPDPSRIAS